MTSELKQSIEDLVGPFADDNEARALLHALLAAARMPCPGINDITMLFETAIVITGNTQFRSKEREVLIMEPILVEKVHQNWLERASAKGKNKGKDGSQLYPAILPEDKKPFYPYIDQIKEHLPHVQHYFLNRGISFVYNARAVLILDCSYEDATEIVGHLYINTLNSEEAIRALLPEEFFELRTVSYISGMRRWAIKPCSMDDLVQIALNFEVGLTKIKEA